VSISALSASVVSKIYTLAIRFKRRLDHNPNGIFGIFS
jgi:hypothetical protein